MLVLASLTAVRDSIQKEPCKEQSVLLSYLLTKCCAKHLVLFFSTWYSCLVKAIATGMGVVVRYLTVTVAVTVSRQPLDRRLAENTAS